MHVYRLSSALALTALVAAAACSDNTSPALTAFYANMDASQIVATSPVVSSATGQATIDNFTGAAPPAVKVTYTGLTPTRIALMSGAGTVNGTVLADVCGGAGPVCGASGATYNSALNGTNTSQGIYNTMKGTNGGTYLTVFTTAHPASAPNATTGVVTGGEIRGAIVYTPAAP
jgi:hypothetical protein